MLAKYFSFLSLIKVNCNVFSQIFEIIFELSDTEFIDRSSSSSSSLGKVSTSGQRQTGLGPRVYPFLPQAVYCLNQMLEVMLLSQHRVLSSKIVRPCAPCGARCIGHAIRTWSAVCSEAPHSQFGEGARPHLCMDEWNRPTPVRRRLSLTQAAWGKPIRHGTGLGHQTWILEAFS